MMDQKFSAQSAHVQQDHHYTSNPAGSVIDWNHLREVQDRVWEWANSAFGTQRTYKQSLDKLVYNEIPELLSIAARPGGIDTIGPELADCFILLLDLATMWEVDLPEAIAEKMTKNYKRTWAVHPVTGIAQHVEVVPEEPPQVYVPFVHVLPDCVVCHSNKHVQRLETPIGNDDHRCGGCLITFDSTIPF